MRLKGSRCACIWYSLVTGNPENFTEICYLFSCQMHQLLPVQTGILQFCLNEWLAFKAHSRQDAWHTICKEMYFDFLSFLTMYPPPCFSITAQVTLLFNMLVVHPHFLPYCPSPHYPLAYSLSQAQLRFTT